MIEPRLISGLLCTGFIAGLWDIGEPFKAPRIEYSCRLQGFAALLSSVGLLTDVSGLALDLPRSSERPRNNAGAGKEGSFELGLAKQD